MSDKQKVLYVCTPGHTERVFQPGKFDEMLELFDVTWRDGVLRLLDIIPPRLDE